MSQAAPTFSQIKAQVAAIRKKIPHARTVAIRAKGRWTGEAVRQDGEETYSIHQCDSPLAMRIALREGDDSATRVLITDVDDRQIGDDILVRLKPRKVVPLDSWQIVKSLFQARTIDPRITKYPWIAETLMDLPPAAFSPVASGFLDAETVWPILLGRLIGLHGDTPDLLSLLKWSTDADNVAQFRSVPAPFRDAAIEWLAGLAGPTATTVLNCVAHRERPDALPIGLAVGVVFHPNAAGKLEKAAGKMEERYLGGQSPKPPIVAAWNAAATDVVRLGLSDSRLKQQLLTRADEILREVGADSHAWLSDTSPIGFDLRLADLGKRLSQVLSSKKNISTEPLAEARDAVLQHDRHGKERRRMERVEMAMRLVRWLADKDDADTPQSLAEAATNHLREGGFVDWARLTLRTGDPVRELSEAYAQLFDRATSASEQRSQTFAGLLRDWTAAKTTDDTIAPVEQILDRVVAPLASQTPVLVIVIDGMSVAVFRELMEDVLGHDWVLLAEDGVGLRPGMATVPSVTEVSRTSLLTGKLQQGSQQTEKAQFPEHPALLEQCRSGYPPVIFHKASLQESEDASLAADIRKEISSAHRKVVAVVVNAVDDHLLKGEQIDTRWSRDEIKVLPVLLHEAKIARRTVILLSDHGHILDCNASGKKHEGGERWRLDEGEPNDGELRINGPRVVIPESKKLIAPWTEKLRYGIKKNGYHGGVTPQEMIVPIAVLSANDTQPDGWVEAAVDLPAWWEDSAITIEEQDTPTPKIKPQPKKKTDLLFDMEAEEAAAIEPASKEQEPGAKEPEIAEWVTALLESPVYEDQKQLGGRAVPTDDVFQRLLTTIDGRGGKITSVALARAIQFSPMRLRGLLAVAQRVLNVDGYAVLTRDESSDTVELDRNLLLKQFDLIR
ncbi:MAG: BREX-2 system phosphatase PglZ [Planctomycetaceae bacterium]